MKKHFFSTVCMVFVCMAALQAQGLQYSQFTAVPLMLNPGFTGMINGSTRVNVLYKTNWDNIFNSQDYSFYGSVDRRTRDLKNGDYMGIGGSVYYNNLGQNQLTNIAAIASFSYHKVLGKLQGLYRRHGADIGIGVQAGYVRQSVDMSGIYFNNYQSNGSYYNTAHPPPIVDPNGVGHYVLNGGITYSQALGHTVNYVIGIAANNIIRGADVLREKQLASVGLHQEYSVTAGVNIYLQQRTSLRPAVVYLSRSGYNMYVGGAELNHHLGYNKKSFYIFGGLWYRSSDVFMFAGGLAKGRLRVSGSYDWTPFWSNGRKSSTFELAATYHVFGMARERKQLVCNRF